MFLIWGSTRRTVCRGVVADECPLCAEVRAFTLTDDYEIEPIWFMPIGPESLVASKRRCPACAITFDCQPEDYELVLPNQEAKGLTVEELLKRTNPILRTRLEARREVGGCVEQLLCTD